MEEKKKKHGISLMAGEIAEEIKEVGGFCTQKFHADIITEGIDYSALKEGEVLSLGGRKIRITRVGKPCFPECPVPPEKKPCILNRNVAFAEEEKE